MTDEQPTTADMTGIGPDIRQSGDVRSNSETIEAIRDGVSLRCRYRSRTQGVAMSFEEELAALLNKHSRENESNTPDFILAQYVEACLRAFACATQQRETWYGRDARPSLKESP